MLRVCQLFQLVSFLQATFTCSSLACWETATWRTVCVTMIRSHTYCTYSICKKYSRHAMIFWKYCVLDQKKKHKGSVIMRTGLFFPVQLSPKRAEKSFTLDIFPCCSQPLNAIYYNTERAFVWDGPVDTCFPWEQWISSASFKKYLTEERVMSHWRKCSLGFLITTFVFIISSDH